MLTEEQIKKVAHLARLGLSKEEIKKFTKELDGILTHFEKLNEVNTEGVEMIAQITDLVNMHRKDDIQKSILADDLLACSSNSIENHHIKVKNVF